MNKLPKVISHAELVEAIVGQFAFMKMMVEPEDRGITELNAIDLNYVCKKADDHFLMLTDMVGIINQDNLSEDVDLAKEITLFLSEWKEIVDVTAIQQNVHNILNKANNEFPVETPYIRKETDNPKIQK